MSDVADGPGVEKSHASSQDILFVISIKLGWTWGLYRRVDILHGVELK